MFWTKNELFTTTKEKISTQQREREVLGKNLGGEHDENLGGGDGNRKTG